MPVNYGQFNNEEYRALRKVLGLSQQEAQEFHGLKNIRTITQWESGRNTTSQCACDKMLNLMAISNDFIDQKFFDIRHHRNQPAVFLTYKDGENEIFIEPILKIFPTLSAYKMAISRAFAEALSRGMDAHIVIFDEIAYDSYLVANNLDDTLKNRDDWARVHYILTKR